IVFGRRRAGAEQGGPQLEPAFAPSQLDDSVVARTAIRRPDFMPVLQQVRKHLYAALMRELRELRANVGSPPIRMPALELGAKQLRLVDAQSELAGVARPLLGCGLGPVQRKVQRLVAVRLRLAQQAVPGRVRI